MPLSPEDRTLVADMEQRAFHLKKRQRASDLIHHRLRRYRVAVVSLTAVLVTVAVTGIFLAAESPHVDPSTWWLPAVVVVIVSLLFGIEAGQEVLDSRWGRRALARREGRLRRRFSGDLHAARRWQEFRYRGEDISAYVPQVLHLVEGDGGFDSVSAALAFAREHRREGSSLLERAESRFGIVAAEATQVVVSSTDDAGSPSSRIMRFVDSGRPGVWYVTTAPDSPKVAEFDRGRVAVVTVPTASGATVSSNRARIRRADVAFRDIADLYRTQVPGFVDGMTQDEQDRELVYELTLLSAKVETWLDQEVVEFPDGRRQEAAAE